jgi:hypothetical protein
MVCQQFRSVLTEAHQGMGIGGVLTESEQNKLASLASTHRPGMFEGCGAHLIPCLNSQACPGHPATWLRERVQRLRSASLSTYDATLDSTWGGKRWALKEPNAHVVLDRLAERFPNMKYVHVVRRLCSCKFDAYNFRHSLFPSPRFS